MKTKPTIDEITIALSVLKKLDRRIGFDASVACENANMKFFSGLREQLITSDAEQQIQAVITVTSALYQWSLELKSPDTDYENNNCDDQMFAGEQDDA